MGMIVFPLFSSQGFALCIVNEDWPDAPCLDSINNGWYDQAEVNKWSEYYSYKGTPFMEQKHSELSQSIDNDNLQSWVDESTENRNVYEYYFFSGRAPNIGEYNGSFHEFMKNESSTIHDPYTDDERYQLAIDKTPNGGFGIYPEFSVLIIIMGILAGIGTGFGLILLWRKRK